MKMETRSMDGSIEENVSYKLTWMTFIGNILILLEHANLGEDISGTIIGNIMDFFSLMAIPIMGWFFFCTAFLFYRKVTAIGDVFFQIKRRLYTLFLPYIIWNTLGMIIHFLGGEYTYNFSLWNVFRNTYLFYDGVGCGDGPLWYIARLFTYFICTPLIFLIIKENKKCLFLGVEIFLFVINIYWNTNNYDFLYFLPYFILGAFIGMNYSHWFEMMIGSEKRNFFVVSILIFLLVFFSYCRNAIDFSFVHIIYRVVALLLIVTIMKFVGRVEVPNDIVSGIGMYLYCAHDIVYRILRVVIVNMFGEKCVVMQITLVVGAIIVLFISWEMMKRLTPRLLCFLCGGRNMRTYRKG